MKYFTATIKDPVGLHARPASLAVQAATKFKDAEIFIHWKNKSANLKSILNVMNLAIMNGQEIKVEATGKQAEEAINAIKKVMTDNHLI